MNKTRSSNFKTVHVVLNGGLGNQLFQLAAALNLQADRKIIFETELLPTPESDAEKVILYLPEHEWHELSILLYHFFLRSKGIYTVYLGQSLPYDSLIECVNYIKPTKIVTSWLTAVDEQYIVNYFNRLTKETTAQVYCGGYQILQFKESIPSKAVVFHNMSELAQMIKI